MNRSLAVSFVVITIGTLLEGGSAQAAARVEAAPLPSIICATDATQLETLAASEVRRYVYLRTRRLLPLKSAAAIRPGAAGAIVIARKDRAFLGQLPWDPHLRSSLNSLTPQQYWLKTLEIRGRRLVLLTGGEELGALYAAYRFAEHLGIRFYLHGDVVPDDPIGLRLPVLDERATPLFGLRGIQPFHDFPEGPDWWNTDDYQAIIGQLPKLRMNFLGLHTYPENAPNAEPTVWIGPPNELGANGEVRSSYPASYQNTLRGNWGYAAKKTSDFVFGGAQLFEHDAFGPDPMIGHCPQPASAGDCNAVFDATATMLRLAFTLAHKLGVKTCLGTETPLVVPKEVTDRLKAAGKNPAEPRTLQELYEGVFQRVARAYPVDYYWFWTPEGWTWEGTKDEQVKRTLDDLSAAIAARQATRAPFQLATCGWVLGPQQDRALFDKALPKEVSVSCINREVGKTPVDKGFSEVLGRGKWAIPWMEDDPALTSPQLWVGRMRRDAADARRYGCDGLMGIHWRTRVLGPNVSALAQAAWDQSAWNPSPTEALPGPHRMPGPVGGQTANYTWNAIAGTEDAPLYQSVRYNLSAYRLPASNGVCSVTLKFCEPHYSEPGKRVFDVKLQGRTILEKLDIFARVGKNRALDYSYENVAVTNGWIDLDFVPEVEFPSIAAIVVKGNGFIHKINCGGQAYKDFAADWPTTPAPRTSYPSTTDFYLDWARHEFGPDPGPAAAALFEKVDCFLPRPSDWVDGPGGIRPDPRPWAEVAADYDFVDRFAALLPLVQGAGSRARFDYWLATFRYLRSMAKVNCTWALYNQAMQEVKALKDSEAQKLLARGRPLALRRQLVAQVREVYDHLFATVSTTGELGTVANWDQHLLPGLLTQPGEELARILGEALPADARPDLAYRGPTRIIVPTVRGSLGSGETLRLKVIVLSQTAPRDTTLRWRRLGASVFHQTAIAHVARGVYSVELPRTALREGDLEYYVEVRPVAGPMVRFPPTAPTINQTVVVMK